MVGHDAIPILRYIFIVDMLNMVKMDFKGFIRYTEEQIPSRLKTDRFMIFHSIIKKRNIGSTEELQEYLTKREELLLDFLKHNKTGGTMEGQLREKAEELNLLHHIQRNFLKYL